MWECPGSWPLVSHSLVPHHRGMGDPDRQAGSVRSRYDRLAPVYGPVSGWWEAPARRRGLRLLGASPGETILEVGCGPGAALPDLVRAVAPGGRVVGLDLSFRMCSRASRKLPGPRAWVVEGDARRLPLVAGSCDGVLASFTLELFPDAEIPGVLAEVRRVLRRGGRLVVVSLTDQGADTIARRLYRTAHDRHPEWIDCRPIDVAGRLARSGFSVSSESTSIASLPVEIAVGRV